MRPATEGYPHIPLFSSDCESSVQWSILKMWIEILVITELVFWWYFAMEFLLSSHHPWTTQDHRRIAGLLLLTFCRIWCSVGITSSSSGNLWGGFLQSLDEWCPLFVKDGWKHPSLDFGTLSSSHLMLSGLWNCILQIENQLEKSTPWYFHEFHAVCYGQLKLTNQTNDVFPWHTVPDYQRFLSGFLQPGWIKYGNLFDVLRSLHTWLGNFL